MTPLHLAAELEVYIPLFEQLIQESLRAAPRSWQEGFTHLELGAFMLNYAVKNPNSPHKARINDRFRAACDALYRAMKQDDYLWDSCQLHYFCHNHSWKYSVEFEGLECLRRPEPPIDFTEAPPEGAPVELVRKFIADYYVWNQQSAELAGLHADADSESWDDEDWDDEREDEHDESIAEAYQALIDRYCPPGYRHEPLAYGTESSHHPQQEKIITLAYGEQDGQTVARVQTQMTKDLAGLEYHNDYEYLLRCVDQRWYLISLCVVLEGKRYEGL